MKIKVNKVLQNITSKKYISLEYVIEEVLPMIDNQKSRDLPIFLVVDDDDVEIEISDNLLNEIRKYFNEDWTFSRMIEYVLSIGYVLGV